MCVMCIMEVGCSVGMGGTRLVAPECYRTRLSVHRSSEVCRIQIAQ